MSNSSLDSKTILITGGTGSFGSTVCKFLVKKRVKEIRIFSRDEKKQDDMRKIFKDKRIKFQIGDIRDRKSVAKAVRKVDYIFHAAALKQVPSCEFYPLEAVKTNIIGADNLIVEAINAEVKKIICLSTDKAVYPINAMGVSKSMMEKVISANARDSGKTDICITRYGNVIYSRGSVIPLFVDQILNKKFLTVTNPKMTRFMMTMEDAINLVLFAFRNGKNGEIFVKKSPASSIEDIIKAIGIVLNTKTKIKTIGLRHGEKFHETLLTKEEFKKTIDYKNFYKIKSDNRDLNYENYFSKGEKVKKYSDYTSENTKRLTLKENIKLLRPIIKRNLNKS